MSILPVNQNYLCSTRCSSETQQLAQHKRASHK